MIGNDIVDLVLAQKESNWRRKGYLDKIFTQKEQLLILNANNPDVMVWNLWTRKEAAYKIYNRHTRIRAYNPLQFECFALDLINNATFGAVKIKHRIYFTKTEIESEFIHSIAVCNVADFDKVIAVKTRKNIRKVQGIPECFTKGIMLQKPISISHHGRFERIVRL